MINKIRNLIGHRDLITQFVIREIKVKYIGSFIGFFWSVIHPLIILLTYTFIFSIVLKVKFGKMGGITNFAFYMFTGFLPWFAFQESVSRSADCIVENANLIKFVVFPSKIFPLSLTISAMFQQFIGILILIVAILISKQFHLSIHVLLLPVLFFAQLIFTVGLGWFVAALNVFFRDTSSLVKAGLFLWMFVTPIFYSIKELKNVDQYLRWIIIINPMTHLVIAYRCIFLRNSLYFDLRGILIFSVFALVFFIGGFFLFEKTQPKFADLI